jgi:hypothetical protein
VSVAGSPAWEREGFEGVQGLDDVAAIADFEDVGGRDDAMPSRATLYHVDGAWKVFYVTSLQ